MAPPPLILCYHALSPSWGAELSTTPARFERQIRLLLRRGYAFARFSDAVETSRQRRAASITFDDAFRSVYEHAFPILRRLGIPATVYVPTDHIDAGGRLRWPGIDGWIGGPDEDELTPMSWTEIRALHQAGWEIGSHTGSHPRLTELADDLLDDELRRSKQACEQRLAVPCRSIAYPYGDVDARVIAAAERAGYATGAALPARLALRGRLEWPRIGVYHLDDDRRFRLKVSPALVRVRRTPAWGALSVLTAADRRRADRPT